VEVGNETAVVTKVSFGSESEEEEETSDDAAGDEERFEDVGANIRDVWNFGAGVHGDIVRFSFSGPDDEHGEESAYLILKKCISF